MTTFRKTLMATTVLAGLAIFAIDAAQAGPNGPSLGSISGFSSMRMDFNRIGGPGRALSRGDMRIVPLDAKKAEKTKSTKNLAKKGTEIARVSNPKSASGGKSKEVASAPALRIPAPLAEIFRVTGGNLDDISQLAELASWLQTGLPAAGSPFFDKGDGSFVPPTLGAGNQGDKSGDRFSILDGWLHYSSASHPFGNPNAKAGQDSGGGLVHRREVRPRGDGNWPHTDQGFTVSDTFFRNGEVVWSRHEDNGSAYTGVNDSGDPVIIRERQVTVSRPSTGDISHGPYHTAESEIIVTPGDGEPYYWPSDPKPEDEAGQPTEEGTGRPGRSGWCSPTGGCVTASVIPPRRIIPAEDYSTPQTQSQLPSWATDPAEEGYAGGGGSGYSGYTPQDEGDGAPDGPGGSPM